MPPACSQCVVGQLKPLGLLPLTWKDEGGLQSVESFCHGETGFMSPVGPMLIVGFHCSAIFGRLSAASRPRALYCRVVALIRLLGLVAGLGGVLLAQAPPGRGNVAPFYPTPMQVAVKMLQEAELKAGELHYDLGSGDGRLVILAAVRPGT